jgi:DNA-binding GntR family transcriptional regulator
MPATRPSAPDVPSVTAAQRVLALLEAELMQGRHMPGARLDEQDIAGRCGVSRTPVREALKALAAEGLVEIRAHAGAFVSCPTPQRLLEMFETMAVLEAACAADAARRASPGQQRAIARANRACAGHARSGDTAAFYAANQAFHDAIYAAAGNTFLAAQTLALRRRLEPWRRAVTGRRGLMQQSVAEHAAILAAIDAGDAAAAAGRAGQHLDTLGQDALLLLSSLAAVPAAAEGRPRRTAAGAGGGRGISRAPCLPG